MELPPLMSVADFKKATYIGFFCDRVSLEPIDRQLALAHMLPSRPDEYFNALRELCALCSNWFAAKTRKELGPDSSKSYLKRKEVVWRLSDQVLTLLKAIQFEKQKAASKITQNGSAFVTKGLSAGYGRERREFEAKKRELVQTAERGGKVDVKGRIDPTSLSFVSNGLANFSDKSFSKDGLTASEVELSARKLSSMDTAMADPDFKSLFQMLNGKFKEAIKTNGYLPTVHYVRKRERISNLMLIPIGGLLYHGDISRPYDSFGNRQELYAMDRWGNLMILSARSVKPASSDHAEADYRHSSLNAGNAVICAGMMTLRAGKVTSIDNRSGHYRPTPKNLSVALQVFQEYGLDLSETFVEAQLANGTNADRCRAADFLLKFPADMRNPQLTSANQPVPVRPTKPQPPLRNGRPPLAGAQNQPIQPVNYANAPKVEPAVYANATASRGQP